MRNLFFIISILFDFYVTDLEQQKSNEISDSSSLLSNQIGLIKPSELDEHWIRCSTQLKPLIFYHILADKGWRGVLCFTHFTDATHRLTRLIHHLSSLHGLNLNIEEISSERSFNDRHRILNDFRAGKIDVSV